MEKLNFQINPKITTIFENYPESVRDKMDDLRTLIIQTATDLNEITHLEETLKWGEPSYISNHGSTIRIDWKKKNPNQYAMYFNCSSKLITTFRIVFNRTFLYEGNRAIIFDLHQPLPEIELKKCIEAALLYHKIKKLPLLGL